MEEDDEIHAQQAHKFPRLGNGRNEPNKIGPRGRGSSVQHHPDEEQNNDRHINHWSPHSSRIIRVSRASGGKDRHSKVMTSKGSRDRRVRLSVSTAIQFYDLQDRLGYDQPSKAVEWLIKSAADAIAELPSLPETPSVGTEQQGFENDSPDAEGAETNIHHQQNQNQNQSQNLSLSKSGCSSTSETSKGSGLSLSRSDIRVNRVKARERARERASKEKEKEKESDQSHIAQHQHQHQNVNPISQTASFTELLTGGISNAVPTTTTSSPREWCSSSSAPMDYFNTGLLGPSSSRAHNSSGFSFSQIQLGHSQSLAEAMSVSLPFSGENHHSSASDQLHQQFSFIPDHHHHLMPEPAVVTSSSTPSQNSGNHYDLNFTISSGLAGFNRGTLQSNSPSAATTLLPHHLQQRFSHLDGSTVPFFLGAAAAAAPHAAAPAMENNHHHQQLQFSPVFDGGSLQLCYGEGCRHSDQKPKAKN